MAEVEASSEPSETPPVEVVVPASEPRLPLPELDRALDPLRRSLAWALRDPQSNLPASPYLGAISRRGLHPALSLDLPTVVREQLAEIGGQLDMLDGDELEARIARAQALAAALARLDAQLGLPLGLRVRKRRSRRPVVYKNVAEGRVTKGRGKGSKKRADAVEPAPEALEDELLLEVDDDSGSSSSAESATASLETLDRRIKRKMQHLKAKANNPNRKKSRKRAPDTTGNNARFRPGDERHLGRPLASMGLDPDVVAHLDAAGIDTPMALLEQTPSGEELVRPIHGAGREVEAGRVALGGRVQWRATRCSPTGERTSELGLTGAGAVRVTFGRALAEWEWSQLQKGERAVLVGEWSPDTRTLSNAEPASDDGNRAARLSLYEIDGVPDTVVRRLVAWMLPELASVRDPLPNEVVKAHALPAYDQALVDIHTKGAAATSALSRMAFDDALLAVVAHSVEARSGGRDRGIAHAIVHGHATQLCAIADEQLDDQQQAAFEAIKRDLRSSTPMSRCLMGEAGAGKTVVGVLSMVMVAESKNQVLFVSPDRSAAEHRFLFMEPLLREIGLVARILDGEPTANQRDALRRGEVHVVFGTAELLEQNLEFRRLGLVVGEERERFGRLQRLVRGLKQPTPDLLVLNPVPVPASAILSVYASQDISVVHDTVARAMTSSFVTAAERDQAYAKAKQAVERGRQVVVVFPQVRGGDALDAREALQVKAALEKQIFEGARVSLFHGAMSREERHQTYMDFRRHRADVLVATAPLEDGPPLPAVQVAIVEQADRTDLGRLYRLRGQLMRSRVPEAVDIQYVVGATPDEEGAAWVKRLVDASDPLTLFEEWVEERGMKSVVEEGAPEPPTSAWIDPLRDRAVLLTAHSAARRLVASDPGLRRGNHSDLLAALERGSEALIGTPFSQPDPAEAGNSRRRRRRRKRR